MEPDREHECRRHDQILAPDGGPGFGPESGVGRELNEPSRRACPELAEGDGRNGFLSPGVAASLQDANSSLRLTPDSGPKHPNEPNQARWGPRSGPPSGAIFNRAYGAPE